MFLPVGLSTEPAMQFTGPGQDLVTVEGRLYPRLFGGLKTSRRGPWC
jgi:phage protein U